MVPSLHDVGGTDAKSFSPFPWHAVFRVSPVFERCLPRGGFFHHSTAFFTVVDERAGGRPGVRDGLDRLMRNARLVMIGLTRMVGSADGGLVWSW